VKIIPEVVQLPGKELYLGEWTVEEDFFKRRKLRQGRGQLLWPDGTYYQGFFLKDKSEGFGRLVHP